MGMSGFYGTPDDAESVETIRMALDRGLTLFDTADRYGLGRNEELVGRALREHPAGKDAVVATKFGIVPGRKRGTRDLDGSAAYVREACEASLRRLGREAIDLYYLHRVDPKIPIEETVGAMGRLVTEGKVRFLGLCEASVTTLHRAVSCHPIAALQTEYSLFFRGVEGGVLDACKALGIGFVAYAPLGLGFLAGSLRGAADFAEGDYRPSTPRFQGDNLERNFGLLASLDAAAKSLSCAPAQLALAWLLRQHDFIVPIPGTKRRTHLEENLAALDLPVGDTLARALADHFHPAAAAGDRYSPEGMRWLNG